MGGEAYYNEHDAFAAAWLRELIADGLIAPGEVDERSIEDVRPSDLAGFVQCHFFAGIGIWSLALRQAGWPDDAPIWTGSCPCQPFSAAGKGGGFDDERHLWPAFHWLIEQCRPELILGEQVASKDGLAWLDLVSTDVEASGYAFGAADTCAAGFGAPHIRQRLYWMADSQGAGRREQSGGLPRTSEAGAGEVAGQGHGDAAWADGATRVMANASHEFDDRRWSRGSGRWTEYSDGGHIGSLANADDARLEGRLNERECAGERSAGPRSVGGGLADSDGGDPSAEWQQRSVEQRQQPQDGGAGGVGNADCSVFRGLARSGAGAEEGAPLRASCDLSIASGENDRPGPLNGLWRDADWLCCTDGKWRPVAPGTFPLAPAGTVRNRVGTLRGAGNAINLAQAQGFVEAVIEVRSQPQRLAA